MWKLVVFYENRVVWEVVFILVWILNELKWMGLSYEFCFICVIKSFFIGL